jgi:glyoxylase-like metal-dependent hydrolase (beta-lactamase superfamily II)
MNAPSDSASVKPPAVQPLAVAQDCWMIGFRNPSSLLQCNTYLRIFAGPRQGTSVCIDPGSQFDAFAIEDNLRALTGDDGVDFITVNHQDPDVTGNLPALCRSNQAATVMLSEDTWRLVQHLRVRPAKLQFPPALGSRRQILTGGIAWQPVPTPFCHFRGAMAWYDPESRILFSGDLFGGLNQLGRVHLFAEEADWAGIAQFHQIYMPSREVLRYTIRQIRALLPAVQTIAPQHGHVITGDLVPLLLDRMEQLLVGYDLLSMELDDRYTREYTELIAEMITYATEVMGADQVEERLAAKVLDDQLDESLANSAGQWQVRHSPYATSAKVFHRLAQDEESTFVEEIRNRVLRFCEDRAIPVPPIGWGMENRAPAPSF